MCLKSTEIMVPENRGAGKPRTQFCYNLNMKKLLPWFTAFIIIFITFGAMYSKAQQSQRYDINNSQVHTMQNTANSEIPAVVVSGKIADPASLILLEFAGAVTVLVIVYLIGTMPTISRK